MEKDKWGRPRKFIPRWIKCGYRKCDKLFLQKVSQHKFCHDDHRIAENSLKSYDLLKKRKKKNKKKCSVEGCNDCVGDGLRMLCEWHYKNGGRTYFEEALSMTFSTNRS